MKNVDILLQKKTCKMSLVFTLRAFIRQVAGFNNPAYFSRIFKRHFGMSPRKWQN